MANWRCSYLSGLVLVAVGLVRCGEAVGEEGEAADDHEAIQDQGADRGRQWAVLPGG